MKEEQKLYCPNCRHELKIDGVFRYDDDCGGASISDKYICNNLNCECCKYNCVWNWYGDFFGGDMPFKLIRKLFLNDKYAAYNSPAKKSEIEIFGKGLKRQIYLHPAFCFWILQPFIEFKYKGTEWGNVLGRKWKLKFLKYDRGQKRYCIVYKSGIHMLIWSIKRFYNYLKYYREKQTLFGKNELKNSFNKPFSTDKRWWILLSRWYFNTFYKKLKLKLNEN